jgi:hypothetical protein
VELINATRMVAGFTLGMDPDGREHIVVAVKGTFVISRGGEPPRLADEQAPLVMADELTGPPGYSAVLYESDFPPFKPRCDVLLNGSAYAPGGRPATSVPVGLRVGTMSKTFNVVGDRRWEESLTGVAMGDAAPFVRMPITYDRAFGGVDVDPVDPEARQAFAANPVGMGFHPLTPSDLLVGKPVPNTEELDRPITSTTGKYAPMSFGPIGRNFGSRIPLAGTYDQKWLDEAFPFLPTDFDPLYHQAAPPEQQIDHPRGGEWVDLVNLTPEGRITFQLPAVDLPVEFTHTSSQRTLVRAVVDTVVIEPDLERFSMVARASIPLQRNIFEIKQGVVGRMPHGWYRARDLGKTYYPSLAELAASRATD